MFNQEAAIKAAGLIWNLTGQRQHAEARVTDPRNKAGERAYWERQIAFFAAREAVARREYRAALAPTR